MKFTALLILTFSFAAQAYHSPTVGNRPERIEIPSYEKRIPASEPQTQPQPNEGKKSQKTDKKQ